MHGRRFIVPAALILALLHPATATAQVHRSDLALSELALARNPFAPVGVPLPPPADRLPLGGSTTHASRDHVGLSVLHAVTGAVQAFDGILTVRALGAGATETNPLMTPFARHEELMLGVKIGATIATVMSAERLWHRGHRTSAIVLMVAVNGAMGLIVRHNLQVLASLDRR